MMEETKVKYEQRYLTTSLLFVVLKKNFLIIIATTLLVSLFAGYHLSNIKPIHRIDVCITSNYDKEELFELYVMLPFLFNSSDEGADTGDIKLINNYKLSYNIDDFDTLYYLKENIFSVKIIMSEFDKNPKIADDFITLLNNLSFTSGFIQKEYQKRDTLNKLLENPNVNKDIVNDLIKNLELGDGKNIQLFRVVNKNIPYQNYVYKKPNVIVSTLSLTVTVFIAMLLLFAQLNLRKKEKV